MDQTLGKFTMTKQEIFDKIVRHLATMTQPSLTHGGMCAYRGADGAMCAVGCLIDDADYDDRMEGNAVSELLTSFPEATMNWARHINVLEELQSFHDGSYLRTDTLETRARELNKIALAFSLDPQVIEEYADTQKAIHDGQ